MPLYSVSFLPAAQRDLKRLAKTIRKKDLLAIQAGILGLAENPRPDGCKALQGFPGIYRIRNGDFRVACKVTDSELLVLVVVVGDGGDVYELLRRRLVR